jgi:hypothetical protein
MILVHQCSEQGCQMHLGPRFCSGTSMHFSYLFMEYHGIRTHSLQLNAVHAVLLGIVQGIIAD